VMGDHRATIVINFTMHGKTYKMDSWVNYNGWDGVDSRVIEFFQKSWEDAMWRYQEEDRKAEKKRKQKEDEEKDKKEYERLSKKYATKTGGNNG
jgi:hypothetical protein